MSTNDFPYNNPGNPDQTGNGQNQAGGEQPGGNDLPGWTSQVTLQDVRRIYVKKGYERFEPLFTRCDQAGGMQPSFTIAPFFISFVWFMYRKMYMEGFILMGVGFVLMSIGGGAMSASPETGGALALGLNLIFLLGMMVYGKALYWKAVDRKIARAMRIFPDSPQKAMAWLSGVGGTNVWIVVGYFVLVAVLVIAGAAGLSNLENI